MKRVTILGATGSIGLRTLDLVSSFPEEFRVAGLAARGSNVERVADLCRKFAPAAVALLDASAVDRLARLLPAPRPDLLVGPEGPFTAVEFDEDSGAIVATTEPGTVVRYRCRICGAVPELARLADERLRATGRQLTPEERELYLP